MDTSSIWAFIGAAAAVFGIGFGLYNVMKYKKEKEQCQMAEQYRDGLEDGSLKKDMEFLKTNSIEILRDLKRFKAEQAKTNECFEKRLTIVEIKLDEHVKNS